MTTYSEECKRCGKVFYLSDYLTGDYKEDAKEFIKDQKEHIEKCKEKELVEMMKKSRKKPKLDAQDLNDREKKR